MKHVTGLGGIFFKADDPEKLYLWYEEHLGLQRIQEGAPVIFPWRDADDPERTAMTIWSVFPRDTKYFDPGRASFMLNYCVQDLDGLLETLRREGVTVDGPQDSEHGRFAWTMDPEGNRIELWEPPKG